MPSASYYTSSTESGPHPEPRLLQNFRRLLEQGASYVRLRECVQDEVRHNLRITHPGYALDREAIPFRHKARTWGRDLARVLATEDADAILKFLERPRPSFVSTGELADSRLFSRLGIVRCSHCDETFGYRNGALETSGGPVFDCCEENYVYSGMEDTHIHREDAVDCVDAHGDDDYCTRSWARSNLRMAPNGIYVHHNYYAEYMADNADTEDDVTDEVHARWRGQIGSYHSSVRLLTLLPSVIFDKRKTPLRAGIELEVEVNTSRNTSQAAAAVVQLLNANGNFALAESDGSLNYGFELVTRFGGLDVLTEKLAVLASPEFKEVVKKYGLKSHDTSTCGLHVTIDRADMTPLHIGKMRVFAHSPNNRHLFEAVCRRYSTGSQYAKLKPQDNTRIAKAGKTPSGDRYDIFNFTKSRVIEFRGPRGTLKYESVIAAIEFARMCWFFTEKTSLSKLDTASFLDFIVQKEFADETKFLRQYLIERKVLAPPLPQSSNVSRRLNLREAWLDAMASGHIALALDV